MIGALVAGITGSGGAVLSSYESIATATGTGSSGEIVFSSIPSTFKHLQIRFIAKDTWTTDADVGDILIRFNSDTGSNYSRHSLTGNGTTAAAAGSASQNGVYIRRCLPTNKSTLANMMGVGIVDVLDYTSTVINKTARAISGTDTNGTTLSGVGNDGIALSSSVWLSTSAITSVTIRSAYSNAFTTSTSVALYGIKEA